MKTDSHGQVYSLRGKIGHPPHLVQASSHDRAVHRPTKPCRFLPYKRRHQLDFLSLEQDTDTLLHWLQTLDVSTG